MDLKELLAQLDSGAPLVAGSEAFMLMQRHSAETRRLTAELNGKYHEPEDLLHLMSLITGSEVDPTFRLFTPFYTDFGKNIRFGRNVFVNMCCCFQDQGGIRIGDNALIGHRCTIATLNHEMDPSKRQTVLPAKVVIGNDVWIGSDVTICPGAIIEDGAVVGAGALVRGRVGAGTVVAGVPAKFIRNI